MPNASISRWTLLFFGCGLAILTLALGLMVAGVGYPHDDIMAPRTLIVVHLVAIGWLTLTMFGALLQFLPVLVGRDLLLSFLAPIGLAIILGGLVLMVSGFAALDGAALPSQLLPWGGIVLLSGFSVMSAILLTTVLRARILPLPACFVAVALIAMPMTAIAGEGLAGAITGIFGGDIAMALVTHAVPLHAALRLGCWLTFAAMGVSYRLLSMFLVAPERQGWRPQLTFWAGVAALASISIALGLLVALSLPIPAAATLALFAATGSVAAYLGDVVTLYRTRRRKGLELHMTAALGAFAMLALGSASLIVSAGLESEFGTAAGVYLLMFGWLTGLSLAMLYKIVPFLTWLEYFAPNMGRTPTPRVQDLVNEGHARHWFSLYFLATGLGGAALYLQQPMLFRMTALLQLTCVILLAHQLVRARLLLDLATVWQRHARPHLLLPSAKPRT